MTAHWKNTSTRRKLCCTFCCVMILTIISLVIAGGILAATFKRPDVQVGNIRSVDGSTNVDGHIITAKWLVDVNVTNDNYYDLFVTSADVRTLLANITPDAEIATGRITNTNINGGGRITTLVLPLNLNWDISQTSTVPAITSIWTRCQASANSKIPATYLLDVKVKFFHLGPFSVPTIITNIDTPCPDVHQNSGTVRTIVRSLLG